MLYSLGPATGTENPIFVPRPPTVPNTCPQPLIEGATDRFGNLRHLQLALPVVQQLNGSTFSRQINAWLSTGINAHHQLQRTDSR